MNLLQESLEFTPILAQVGSNLVEPRDETSARPLEVPETNPGLIYLTHLLLALAAAALRKARKALVPKLSGIEDGSKAILLFLYPTVRKPFSL